MNCLVLTLALFFLAFPILAHAGWSYASLGTLPGDSHMTEAYCVSPDGLYVGGAALAFEGRRTTTEAVVWESGTGLRNLDLGIGSAVRGHSGAGGVAVGYSQIDDISRAFLWPVGESPMGIEPPLAELLSSSAHAVSSDGTSVAGYRTSDSTIKGEAYRWSAGRGMEGLGVLQAGWHSSATEISADGRCVIGRSWDPVNVTPSSDIEAFLWRETTGMIGLGDLPGGARRSVAEGVSSDGATIVGWSDSGIPAPRGGVSQEAFMWSAATGMIGMGAIEAGGRSVASDVSGDGSVVVGHVFSAGGRATKSAFIWTRASGMRSLQAVLEEDGGLDLGGHQLAEATAISSDGRTVVGNALPGGAWIATLGDEFPKPFPAIESVASEMVGAGVEVTLLLSGDAGGLTVEFSESLAEWEPVAASSSGFSLTVLLDSSATGFLRVRR